MKVFLSSAVHEECKESDLAVVKSETEHSLRHGKEIAGVISAFRIVVSQGSTSFLFFFCWFCFRNFSLWFTPYNFFAIKKSAEIFSRHSCVFGILII